MNVKDLMTSDPVTCTPGTSAAVAAKLMLDADCGILPVVDDGKLVGVVTDRDLFIALGTRNTRAAELSVGSAASPNVWTAGPEDDVQAVLEMMKHHRIRRVPVVGFGGVLQGIVSMNDILLAVRGKKTIRSEKVVDALQAICTHHQPLVHISAA